jgi:hypothetical protein
MPAVRPRDFAVVYERCSSLPGHGIECHKFTVATDPADCLEHDGCYRPADAELDAVYQELRRQGFVSLRTGSFGPRHSSQRLVAFYGGKACEVVNAALRGVQPEDWDRLRALMDRVLEATKAPPAPITL